jgi:hypothetical protein
MKALTQTTLGALLLGTVWTPAARKYLEVARECAAARLMRLN